MINRYENDFTMTPQLYLWHILHKENIRLDLGFAPNSYVVNKDPPNSYPSEY